MSSDIGKLETDVEIKASAEKFHEMFRHKPHHLTHASSDKIHGCELHEGEWGQVGSVIYWNYFHGETIQIIPIFIYYIFYNIYFHMR